MADAAAQQNLSALYYGEACTDAVDVQPVQALFGSGHLDLAQSMFAQAQEAHHLLQSSSAQQPSMDHFRRPPKPPNWYARPLFLYCTSGLLPGKPIDKEAGTVQP